MSAKPLGVLDYRHQRVPHLGRELTGTEGLGQEVVDVDTHSGQEVANKGEEHVNGVTDAGNGGSYCRGS